jgi:hypothetical protein
MLGKTIVAVARRAVDAAIGPPTWATGFAVDWAEGLRLVPRARSWFVFGPYCVKT